MPEDTMTGLDDIMEICDYWEFLDHYFVQCYIRFFFHSEIRML